MKMMKNLKTLTVLTIAVFVCLMTFSTIAFSVEFYKDGHGYRTEVTHEYKVKADGKLDVSNIVGDVTVVSWTENKVKIVENILIDVYTKEEAEEVYKNYTLEIKEAGNLITATGPKRYRGYVDISYIITLPQKFSAEINTSGGDFNIKDISGTYNFKTSGGDVDINNASGNITCSTSGGDLDLNQVKGVLIASTSGGDVTCTGCGDDLDLKTSGGDFNLRNLTGKIYAKTSGGDIKVDGVKGELELKTSGGDIDLRQIESTKSIQASTSGGDIDVRTVTGNLQVKTSGGDINISGIKGDLEATTSGGDLEIDDVFKNVDISTSGGDITVRKVGGYTEANTSGGDIEIQEVKGYVETVTSGGDIKVNIKEYSNGVDQHVDMKSTGGDLTLVLPGNFKGSIDAYIEVQGDDPENYSIYCDFPIKISIETEPGAEKNKSKFFKRHSWAAISGVGDINGGGNRINLSTVNGNIYIKKR